MKSDMRVWMGRFLAIVVIGASWVFPISAAAQVPGGCPLPPSFKIKNNSSDGTCNKTPSSISECFEGSNYSDVVDKDTVDDLNIIRKDSPDYELKEDTEKLKIDFEIPGFGITAWTTGAQDTNTQHTADQHKWSPNDQYHSEASDGFPYKTCHTFDISQSKWTGAAVWKIEKAAHAYHFDGPTNYGARGGIGDNPVEKDVVYSGDKGQKPEDMTYVVPSVPYMYFVSSGMTATWTWDYTDNEHYYKHDKAIDVKENYGAGDGNCDICNRPKGQDYPNWKHTGVQKSKMTGIEPEDFYTNNAVQHVPQKPDDGYDPDGCKAEIYDADHNLQFALPNQGTVFTRTSVRVIDTKRETFVSFGTGNDCVWKAETGKKITETDSHTVQFTLYDNAPHMRYVPVIDEQLTKQGQNWNVDENFKAIFWYEDIVYDYVGLNNPALGLTEVFYTPKFYLKQGSIWEGVDGFKRFLTDEPKVKACKDGDKNDPPNPQYVEWDITFETKDLFEGEKNGEKEDIVTMHYADKALGDQFGNPRWSRASIRARNTTVMRVSARRPPTSRCR